MEQLRATRLFDQSYILPEIECAEPQTQRGAELNALPLNA